MVKMTVRMVTPSHLESVKGMSVFAGDGEVASPEEIGQGILALREQMSGMFGAAAFVLTIQFDSDDMIPRKKIGDEQDMAEARASGQQIPREDPVDNAKTYSHDEVDYRFDEDQSDDLTK